MVGQDVIPKRNLMSYRQNPGTPRRRRASVRHGERKKHEDLKIQVSNPRE